LDPDRKPDNHKKSNYLVLGLLTTLRKIS